MNRGPLIDDIHELELELELLKRKRLMVQQQQTLLASQQNYSQSRQPDFDFQQSSQQFNQQTNRRYDMPQEHNQARNFSHLYDGPNQQHGLKRHAPDSAFHTNPPAKRFTGPQGGKPNKGPKELPKPWDVDPINTLQKMRQSVNQPQPLMSFETFKKKLNFNPSMSRPAHSNFKPNKVTKPNIDNTPKYKSSPVPATLNNPVAQSSETTKKSNYKYVLRANDPPDSLVNARMEFAMGHILKEIRGRFQGVKKYSQIFNTAPQRETVKKILRKRLRCAMLDKVVGAGKDIIIEYRKMYPQLTDKEILEFTLLACKATKLPNLCIELEDAVNPKQYFINNFNKLFDVELDKMFEKIKNLYMEEHKVNTKSMQEIIHDNMPKPVHVEISTTDNATESGIKTTSNNEPELNKEPATEDSKVPSDVTNTDEQKDATKLKETRSTSIIDETKPPNDNDFEMFCAWKHYNNKFFQSGFYDKLIISGIKQRLHEILPKMKQDIMAIFELDNMYATAKQAIMTNTMHILNPTLNDNTVVQATPAADSAVVQGTPAAAAEETAAPMDVSKYFVRVVGRPTLPNKKFMKEFLDKFNPTSIKKHRQLSYLLFVGFSNKEDYERLLQANGTMIKGDQVKTEGPADVLILSIEEIASGEPEDYKAELPEPAPRPLEDVPPASSVLNIKEASDINIDEKAQPELVDTSHPAVPGDIQACTNEGTVTEKRKRRGNPKIRTLRRKERRKRMARKKFEFEKNRSEENARLLMTASDVSQSAKSCTEATDTNADDDVILVEENKTLDNSSDVSNIISSDLDEQITDLLSSIRKAEEISETQSANEEKGDTVAETQEPEVINLTDDTSSIKEDSECALAPHSQMEIDDVNQERMVPGADEEPTKIYGDKLSVETNVTPESKENQNDDLNTNERDKSDTTKPDETKNEEANNTLPAEMKEDTKNTEKENEQFFAEEKIEINKDTNETEEKNKPTGVTEEITEPKKDTNDAEVKNKAIVIEEIIEEKKETNESEEKNKPIVIEEVIEIEDNGVEKTPIENKTMATVKGTTKGTPVRASSRLANSTPSRVTTRRSSKLAQQNNQ